MEVGECGLTRGTYLVARRVEVVAVAGLLWISCCVGCGGISCFFRFFLFERTRPAASMRPPCLTFTSLLVITCTETTEPSFVEGRGGDLNLTANKQFVFVQTRTRKNQDVHVHSTKYEDTHGEVSYAYEYSSRVLLYETP